MERAIRWLHLTDLHVGMSDQDWLWPRMQAKFREDLKSVSRKTGPWDLVLFTGDLAQKGTDYDKVEEILATIWPWFRDLGCDPKLLAVPGNHDLLRQKSKKPAVKLLEKWHEDPDVPHEFWGDQDSEYRQVISVAFEGYTNWWQNTTFRPESITDGMLPGDFSYTFEKDGLLLGIVGLNSAFLQLTGRPESYQEHLVVDPRQFHAACGGDGVEWAESHHTCFLMTHHPPEWLCKESNAYLNGEILESISLHLCGHQHETEVMQVLDGGASDATLRWLGRSLFGLEKADKGKLDRSHGFISGELRLQENKACLQFMPRWNVQQGSRWNLKPDQNVELPINNERTREFQIKLNAKGPALEIVSSGGPTTQNYDARLIMRDSLESICNTLNSSEEPFVSMRKRVLGVLEDSSEISQLMVPILEEILQGHLMELMSSLRLWLDEIRELQYVDRVREMIDIFAVAGLDEEWVDVMSGRLKQAHVEVPIWTDINLSEVVLTALFRRPVGSWVRDRWINLKEEVESSSTGPQGRRDDILKMLSDRRMGQILQRNANEGQESYDKRRQKMIRDHLPRMLKTDREDGRPYFILYFETAEKLKADMEKDKELWDHILKLERKESRNGVILDEVELGERLAAIFARLDELDRLRFYDEYDERHSQNEVSERVTDSYGETEPFANRREVVDADSGDDLFVDSGIETSAVNDQPQDHSTNKQSLVLRIQCLLTIDVESLEQTRERQSDLQDELSRISGDQSLKIIDIQSACVILKLDMKRDAAEFMKKLIDSGDLTQVLGYPILEFQSDVHEDRGHTLSDDPSVDAQIDRREILRRALVDMDLLEVDASTLEPNGMATGVAGRSEVWFITLVRPAGGEQCLVAKFDEPDRADREWDAIEQFRKVNCLPNTMKPIERNVREHGVVVYQDTNALTMTGETKSLAQYLITQLGVNLDNCLAALAQSLKALEYFYIQEPGAARLTSQGKTNRWSDLVPISDARYEAICQGIYIALPSFTLTGESFCFEALSDVHLLNPIIGFQDYILKPCGRILLSRVHGDLNLSNVLVALDHKHGPDSVFLIDLADSRNETPTALDLARLETEFWHELFANIWQGGEPDFVKVAYTAISSLNFPDGQYQVDSQVTANAIIWINAIRTEAFRILGGNRKGYMLEDYMKMLYILHVRALAYPTVQASSRSCQIALLGAALAKRFLLELEQGRDLSVPVRLPNDLLVVGMSTDVSGNDNEVNNDAAREMATKVYVMIIREVQNLLAANEDIQEDLASLLEMGGDIGRDAADIIELAMKVVLSENLEKIYFWLKDKQQRPDAANLSLVFDYLIILNVNPNYIDELRSRFAIPQAPQLDDSIKVPYTTEMPAAEIIKSALVQGQSKWVLDEQGNYRGPDGIDCVNAVPPKSPKQTERIRQLRIQIFEKCCVEKHNPGLRELLEQELEYRWRKRQPIYTLFGQDDELIDSMKGDRDIPWHYILVMEHGDIDEILYKPRGTTDWLRDIKTTINRLSHKKSQSK